MTKAGKEYGIALYALAKEDGKETEVLEQLEGVNTIFAQEEGWYELLRSPALPLRERLGLIEVALGGKADRYLVNFLKLLLERGRLGELNDCFLAYRDEYDGEKNILRVTAVTAIEMRMELQEKLRLALKNRTGHDVVLTVRTDPAVLGGVQLEYPGRQLDDTLRNRLESIHKALLDAKA